MCTAQEFSFRISAYLRVIHPRSGHHSTMDTAHDHHTPAAGSPTDHVDLMIEGMTCSSCAARVQTALNALPGVDAHVNLALGEARVNREDAATSIEALVHAVEQQGYQAHPVGGAHAAADHAGHHGDDAHDHGDSGALQRRLTVAIPLTVLAMLFSMEVFQVPYWPVWSLLAAIPVVLWCGAPFHQRTRAQLRLRQVGMDTLISLGSLVSLAWSAWVLATGSSMTRMGHGHSDVYAEVAATIVTFILLGRVLEGRARHRAGDAVRSLLTATARDARIVDEDGTERMIPVGELAVGMRVAVRPGERFPADGTVETGSTNVDTSLVTGESLPRTVGAGDEVIGGTTNLTSPVVMQSTRVGAASLLAQIADKVREAQAAKAQVQRLADRVSSVFVPSVIGISILATIGWLLAGASTADAVRAGVSVLIVACPCALGLATPVALLAGTGRGAQLGILVNGAHALETTRHINTIVFDKTGTLTTGVLGVTNVHTLGAQSAEELLRDAAAVESHSNHPIARAIVAEAGNRTLAVSPASDVTEHTGEGVVGTADGQRVHVGRPEALGADHLSVIETARSAGSAVVGVMIDDQPAGWIELADSVREDAAPTLRKLRQMGMTPRMLSGDAQSTAAAIAAQLGIEPAEVTAGVLPTGKAAEIESLREQGLQVAMVGDGSNDAPALAAAHIGIALGSGTDVALQAADITIMGDALPRVVTAIHLARRMWRTVAQNLVWAFGYNIAMIPLAIAGRLNPMLAAAAMAASSLCVVANSLRLRRVRAWSATQ